MLFHVFEIILVLDILYDYLAWLPLASTSEMIIKTIRSTSFWAMILNL